MDPGTIAGMAAIQGVSALAQYWQSEKARGASAAELKKIEDLFNKIVPPQYDVSIMDPPDYITQAIPEPNFDFSKITPEEFKLVGKYSPKLAPYVAEQKPELVKDTAAGREGRDAQLGALRKLRQISTAGSDPELAQQLDEASKRAQVEAQSRSQSILQDAQRRGTYGSGTQLAAELQGGSDAMERAADESSNAAVAAYKNRLQALRDSASLGGQVRSQELELEGRNADVINDFNKRTSARYQDWQNRRSDMLNDAEIRNLDAEQRVSDANVRGNNDAAYRDRDYRAALLDKLHGYRTRERDTQNDLAGRTADWQRGERDNQNDLESKRFDADVGIASGKAGIGQQKIGQINQNAADKNSIISGIANAGTSAWMASEGNDQREKDQGRADARAHFERTGIWPAGHELHEDDGDALGYGKKRYWGGGNA